MCDTHHQEWGKHKQLYTFWDELQLNMYYVIGSGVIEITLLHVSLTRVLKDYHKKQAGELLNVLGPKKCRRVDGTFIGSHRHKSLFNICTIVQSACR